MRPDLICRAVVNRMTWTRDLRCPCGLDETRYIQVCTVRPDLLVYTTALPCVGCSGVFEMKTAFKEY